MISMTGFGRAVAVVGGRRIVVEVRSVNHRGLDVKIRSRVLATAAEIDLLRCVRGACARGSIQISVDEDGGSAGDGAADLGPERLRALAERLEALRVDLGLGGAVDLPTLAAFVRLERERAGNGPAPLGWDEIRPAVQDALAGLGDARGREGRALAQDLRARAHRLDQLVGDIRARIPASADKALRRMTERLAVVAAALRQIPDAGGVDAGRLAQEAAVLADRLDVSEELARLGAHLDRLRDLLAQGAAEGTKDGPGASDSSGRSTTSEGVGRPLEFLLQEVGRELNTLGTKAQDVDISTLVIAGKAELEKIREQAQNIE
jgi:uncharacterized protein (TIGR00255 family)